MPGQPTAQHPWRSGDKRFGFRPSPAKLTAIEVKALREAWATGRFSKRGLGRIYDISDVTVANVLKDTYKPLIEEWTWQS